MSDPITKGRLAEILEAHKLWLENSGGERANLWGANLRGANLRDANLRGANLWGANLTDANLTVANLTDANLRGANLRGANLWDANLTDANLTDANLTDANLWGANLRGANLRGANLWGANLTDANLWGAKSIISFGPVGVERRIGFAGWKDGEPEISLGCFTGTLEQAQTAICEKYGENSSYEALVVAAVAALHDVTEEPAADEQPQAAE